MADPSAAANDYASWLQNHLHYRAEIQFACESPKPAAAPAAPAREPEPEPEPALRPPPPLLLPKRPL